MAEKENKTSKSNKSTTPAEDPKGQENTVDTSITDDANKDHTETSKVDESAHEDQQAESFPEFLSRIFGVPIKGGPMIIGPFSASRSFVCPKTDECPRAYDCELSGKFDPHHDDDECHCDHCKDCDDEDDIAEEFLGMMEDVIEALRDIVATINRNARYNNEVILERTAHIPARIEDLHTETLSIGEDKPKVTLRKRDKRELKKMVRKEHDIIKKSIYRNLSDEIDDVDDTVSAESAKIMKRLDEVLGKVDDVSKRVDQLQTTMTQSVLNCKSQVSSIYGHCGTEKSSAEEQ